MRLLLAVITASALLVGLAIGEQQPINFDLRALPEGGLANHRCFALYIGKNVLVRGKYKVSPGTHQRVLVEVTDTDGSLHHKNEDAVGETKFSFTTHAYDDYILCFTNTLSPQVAPDPQYIRQISFEMETSLDSATTSQSAEKLKPLETELRMLEQMLQGIVDEMEYLKDREIRMRDTNESTNYRVHLLSMLSIFCLVGSGVGQIAYLRRFFRDKKIM